jgi:hypothetical protein
VLSCGKKTGFIGVAGASCPRNISEQVVLLRRWLLFRMRGLLLVVLVGLFIAGCAGMQRVQKPEGPFQIAVLAVTDTRGELEPCG